MKPKISIITISYNSEKTIERTIKSVLSQEYTDLEYIIIDGGSEDNTVGIIQKYSDKIHYWISEKDKGISDAFNKGIAVATGDIIGILNSDDIYMPGALEAVSKAYDRNIEVYRGIIEIEEIDTGKRYTYEPSMKFSMFPIKVNVCHLPTFISREAYQKYGGYDTEFKLAMDLDLLRRFYRNGAKFKYIDIVLGRFYTGGISTKAGMQNCYKEREKVILKNGGNQFCVLLYRVILKGIEIFKYVVNNILHIDYFKIRYKK